MKSNCRKLEWSHFEYIDIIFRNPQHITSTYRLINTRTLHIKPKLNFMKFSKNFITNILGIFTFSMALWAHSGPWPLIQFLNHFSQRVGFLGRVISPSQGLYLNTGQHKHRINAYTHQTFMLWVGFAPTIPASERAKVIHALDRSATVTDVLSVYDT
jgi:hypothetical protein